MLDKQKDNDGSSLLYLAPNETSFFQKYQPLSNASIIFIYYNFQHLHCLFKYRFTSLLTKYHDKTLNCAL